MYLKTEHSISEIGLVLETYQTYVVYELRDILQAAGSCMGNG